MPTLSVETMLDVVCETLQDHGRSEFATWVRELEASERKHRMAFAGAEKMLSDLRSRGMECEFATAFDVFADAVKS